MTNFINNNIQNNKIVVRSADCKTWENNTNNNIIGYIIDDEILIKLGSVFSCHGSSHNATGIYVDTE